MAISTVGTRTVCDKLQRLYQAGFRGGDARCSEGRHRAMTTPYRTLAPPVPRRPCWCVWRVVVEGGDVWTNGQLMYKDGTVLGEKMFAWTAWLKAKLFVYCYPRAAVWVSREG